MKYIFCFYLCFISLIVTGTETKEMSSLLSVSENFKTNLSSSLISSDDSSKEGTDINDLLNLADRFMFRDYKKSLSYAKKASLLAEKKGDSEKKVLSYYYIIRNLFFLRELKEGYSYIEKGMKEEAITANPLYKALFTEVTANYYGLISMPNKQLEEEFKVLKLIPQGKDIYSKILEANTYMTIGDAYIDMEDYPSAHAYADKSIAFIEKIPEKEYLKVKRIYWRKAYIYFYKAWIYLQQNKPQEAYPFIKKAYDQSLIEDLAYQSPFLEVYGDYYFQMGNYHKAIDYYLRTIDNKSQMGHSAEYVESKIASAYRMLGDHDKEKAYLKKSTDQFKKNASEDKMHIQEGLKNMQKEQEQKITEKEQENKTILILVIAIAIATITILIGALIRNLNIRKRKKEIIKEKENQLQHQNMMITEREDTIEKLQLQVNESFAELIHMAKENSPQFFARFQEVYPEVYEKMLEINPKIKVSELTFSAFLYLGFSTKQIATYTSVTVHAVEIRKTRFRKKYNIPSDIDCNAWMKNLVK
ncbi:tetratricopeptide repeat protein [Chryseobacterium sp. StRB126]|uniref:tetratricopeptide repeat protein n=1 Tax=Chryseobacterium sp. StRB126 TaxID=878220 RepID=UPI000A074E44|nr:tetratricopeptide repeat protein [Chryseobacterium sp. StRB126]